MVSIAEERDERAETPTKTMGRRERMTMIDGNQIQRIIHGESRISMENVDKDDVTESAFSLYLSGIIESYLSMDGTETAEDLINIVESATKEANQRLGTDFEAPTFKANRIEKRLKQCTTCDNPFMDISKTNREQTCNRRIAYNTKGRVMERHGKILTECYRSHRNDNRRITDDERSVSQSREVSFGGYEHSFDNQGQKIAANKRNTTSSETNPHDHGYNGTRIIVPNESYYFGIIDDQGKVDKAKSRDLPKDIALNVVPSEIKTINLFNYDWHELEKEYKRIFQSEEEFNRLKERRKVSA